MSFFRQLTFRSFFKKDVIDNDFLDKQTELILNNIDKEFRFKEVNNLPYPEREIKTNLIYAATNFWTYVINASHAIYKKIQILEADFSKVKSELDNKLFYALSNLEDQDKKVRQEIIQTEEELHSYHEKRKAMELRYYAVGDKREVKGSLNRVAPWVFLVVMIIVGAAELFMYKNVFMSQEIGFLADMNAEVKFTYELMALFMALGFTVMIIWMAHKMGEILRHLDNTNAKEKRGYIAKLVVIATVTFSAIWATVDIRSDMHGIMALDTKIEHIQEAREDANTLFDDDENSDAGFGDETDEDTDGGFGSDEEEDSDSGFGSLDEEEGFDNGFGDTDEQNTPNALKTKTSSTLSQEESLRQQGLHAKGETAWLFAVINVFILIGGVFLSYETHTSSKIYETIEKHIKRLEKEKKRFEKELMGLEKKIEKLKSKTINKLFNDLLFRAALYDQEVRTYNTYLQIFEFKMQLIEDYIKNIYDEKGLSYAPIVYKDVLDDKINLDARKELHHVNNIEEYMIYKKKEEENV